jgi:SRSO17 transposase
VTKQEAREVRESELRFAAYLDEIVGVLGDARRVEPAKAYCTALLLPGERKSVEPMAARMAPERVQAKHQSMHHVVANAPWDDAAMLAAVRGQVVPALERHGPISY